MPADERPSDQSPIPDAPERIPRGSVRLILNVAILLLVPLVIYLSYPSVSVWLGAGKDRGKPAAPPRVLQLDVLNGCGVRGIAAKFTDFLRNNGFDVVEMKNYKSSHVERTIVVDRVGDLSAARRVAQALDVSERNIIQQINPDYFVDVSVIVGEDYQALRPSR